jgi:hypothetical protein
MISPYEPSSLAWLLQVGAVFFLPSCDDFPWPSTYVPLALQIAGLDASPHLREKGFLYYSFQKVALSRPAVSMRLFSDVGGK